MARIAVIINDPEVPLDLFDALLPGALKFQAWEALPDIGDFDGLVILGGRMSVEDDPPWMAPENALMLACGDVGIPVLSICLGIQMLAKAAGGEVAVSAAAGVERGAVEIELLPAAKDDPTLGLVYRRLGGRFYAPSSHGDAVTKLPAGACWLARSAKYPYHAFRLKSVLGVQFHPEASGALVERWAELTADPAAGAYGPQFAAHAAELDTLSRTVVEGFLAEVEARLADVSRPV
ncbi:MAG: type 1 glutamine amidotransferase [Propionibacteriaceae bacterium]|nr:type 1 glutamine amidotransferase [Propionibacteriaceae bacterium]